MKNRLMNDLKEAMKEKDTIKKNTIQAIRASILQFEKDKQTSSDDNKVIEIIGSELKKRKDALEQFKNANREDLIKQTEYEIKILSSYLPEQLSDEELKYKVSEIIANVDAWEPGDTGIVMRSAKQEIGNKADGKRVSTIAKDLLLQRQKKLNEEVK